jgi:hypothetical protein
VGSVQILQMCIERGWFRPPSAPSPPRSTPQSTHHTHRTRAPAALRPPPPPPGPVPSLGSVLGPRRATRERRAKRGPAPRIRPPSAPPPPHIWAQSTHRTQNTRAPAALRPPPPPPAPSLPSAPCDPLTTLPQLIFARSYETTHTRTGKRRSDTWPMTYISAWHSPPRQWGGVLRTPFGVVKRGKVLNAERWLF